jgi:DNA polymerase-3 subunit delta'
LLTDLLEFSQGSKSCRPRNPDLKRELENLGKRTDFQWISRATLGLDQLEGGLRRNIGRQLGLDAYTASLGSR